MARTTFDAARTASRLGRGVRPSVASIGDLARMASAQDRVRFFNEVMQLRRLEKMPRLLAVGE